MNVGHHQTRPSAWPNLPVHPVVKDSYEKGFADGVGETLAQLRMRFNLSLIDGLQDFVDDVQGNVDDAR